jgi:hypothetical protein
LEEKRGRVFINIECKFEEIIFMKSIIVDIDENDLKELGISEEHISIEELKKQILIQSLRKQRTALQKLNEEYGFDRLSEDEIFNAVNESETEYDNKKNSTNP